MSKCANQITRLNNLMDLAKKRIFKQKHNIFAVPTTQPHQQLELPPRSIHKDISFPGKQKFSRKE